MPLAVADFTQSVHQEVIQRTDSEGQTDVV